MQTVFHRIEKKYMLNQKQYEQLLNAIQEYVITDKHGNYSICNIYYDTEQFDLIKRSIEKPIYKEKVRLRSYGIPSLNSPVFLEIKKKYRKIGNKRRITLSLKEVYHNINTNFKNSQIEKEISYAFQFYHLKPMMFIAYDRIAYYSKVDSTFRITFDQNVRYRLEDLRLELGDAGTLLLPPNTYIMEVKAGFSYPLWFTEILSRLQIYPTSFSKYGTAYQKIVKEEQIYV